MKNLHGVVLMTMDNTISILHGLPDFVSSITQNPELMTLQNLTILDRFQPIV